MKKSLILIVLFASSSLIALSQTTSLKIKKANVFRIDGEYASKNSTGFQSYSTGNPALSLVYEETFDPGPKVIEFFYLKDHSTYEIDYDFKSGMAYEVISSKKGFVLIDGKTKDPIVDAKVVKTSYDFKTYKKDKIVRLHDGSLAASEKSILLGDGQVFDITVIVYRIDSIYGPSQMGYKNRYNNIMNGNFTIELAPGKHTFYYKVISSKLIGPTKETREVLVSEFTFEPGKTYQFGFTDKERWWETVTLVEKE